MAAVVDTKVVKAWGAPAASEWIAVTYDFSKDAGAVGQLDLFTADEQCVVKFAGMRVITACTSGGSATVGVGKAADLAGIIAATAVASLTAGAFIMGVTALDASHIVAAGAAVKMDIATAALTAGKIEFIFEVCKG